MRRPKGLGPEGYVLPSRYPSYRRNGMARAGLVVHTPKADDEDMLP